MGRNFMGKVTTNRRVLYQGNWFELHQVAHKSGKPQEVFARISGEFFACKALVLRISKKDARAYGLKKPVGRCSPRRFGRLIRDVILDGRVEVPLLAVKRPILQFPELGSKVHYLYELSGGVAHNGEDNTECGVRESAEELRIPGRNILASAQLLAPAPFDSGSHAEMVGIAVVLVQGKISPPNREAIIPKRCRTLAFHDVRKFVDKKRRDGVIVEGYVDYALAALGNYLH